MPSLFVYGSVANILSLSHGNTLSRDIESLESWLLSLGARLLMSKPPISDHSVLVGKPLE